MHPTERRIPGIDPGFGRMGYAGRDVCGSTLSLLTCDAVITPAQYAYSTRLLRLYEQLAAIVVQYQPHEAALELLFFGRNTTTAIPVAQARGVALLALAQHGLPLAEYTPSEMKLAVTGYGAARKQQVGEMVRLLLHLPQIPRPDDAADAADAAAIAICHAHRMRVKAGNSLSMR
jgi:crossover junction endodeoxyribonuclease RuvC